MTLRHPVCTAYCIWSVFSSSQISIDHLVLWVSLTSFCWKERNEMEPQTGDWDRVTPQIDISTRERTCIYTRECEREHISTRERTTCYVSLLCEPLGSRALEKVSTESEYKHKRGSVRLAAARPNYRSLLQKLVSLIGLFCKRDLSF